MTSPTQSTTLNPPTSYKTPSMENPQKTEEKEKFPSDRNTEFTKLTTSLVFDKLRSIVCSINSSIGEASGFFINQKGTILTVAHNISEKNPDFVQTYYEDKPYFPTPSPKLIEEHVDALDLYSMESEIQLSSSKVIDIAPDDLKIKEGMKVYFAGYPLGQDKVTFHKGTISSTKEEEGIRLFTIDGTVVPGNSGAPVVIQHEGKLYLIGVITSEVADFSDEDLKTIAVMKALNEQTPNETSGMKIGNTFFGTGGASSKVKIPLRKGGIEELTISDRKMIFLALDLIQRNLSTGIGKAIDVRHYRNLFQKTPKLKEINTYNFPVSKGKKLISGTISNPQHLLAKYMEVRYGQGKGPRGVRINLHQNLGQGSFEYKFDLNPHTAPGNYNNNNQQELYKNAATKFVQQFLQNGNAIPNSFNFSACKSAYTATLQ